MEEEWKTIIGHGYKYRISNHGRVMSYFFNPPRIKKTSRNNSGYENVTLTWTKGGNRKTSCRYVHRLVAEYFLETPSDVASNQVNHKDGNKFNNHASNLEWVTDRENKKHAIRVLGISPIKNYKMLGTHVDEVRKEFSTYKGKLNNFLDTMASKYGVHRETIRNIYRNKIFYDPRYEYRRKIK